MTIPFGADRTILAHLPVRNRFRPAFVWGPRQDGMRALPRRVEVSCVLHNVDLGVRP